MRVFTIHAPPASGATPFATGRDPGLKTAAPPPAGTLPMATVPRGPAPPAAVPAVIPADAAPAQASSPGASSSPVSPARTAPTGTQPAMTDAPPAEVTLDAPAVTATPSTPAAAPWAAMPRSSVPVLNHTPAPPPLTGSQPAAAAEGVTTPPETARAWMPDRLRLVPEGFSWAAFLFGPFWFLFRGLWLALLIWLATAVLLGGLRSALPVLQPYAPWMTLALMLFTGFHARDAERWTLRRRGLPMQGVVLGLDEEDAMLRLASRRA